MRLAEFTRRATLRRALAIFSAIALTILLSFAYVYHRATSYMVAHLDTLVTQEANFIAGEASQGGLQAFQERLRQDPRRVKPTGLFDAERNRLAGNIESWPREVRIDGAPQDAWIVRADSFGREQQNVRATARRLPNGEHLVVAWSTSDNDQTAEVIKRGLLFGLIPGFGFGLAAAILFGIRAQKRVEEMSARVQRIVAGELQHRLPTQGTDEPLDKLATIVNGMLDEIETLIQSLAGVGDDIAHDLRTPLARVRIGLERARANATSLPDLQAAVDHAIGDIDHAISIVTALLRIREIEQTRRLEGFDNVHLAEVVREVGDLYEPIADEKNLALEVKADSEPTVRGDRDLLFEAVVNLVDNAVKFTPQGGRVEVCLTCLGSDGVVRVSDTGPGVAEGERDLLMQRFYRSDKSRHTKGLGLGLSLVAAIVKLHGFRFSILPGPGFVAEIAFQPTPDDTDWIEHMSAGNPVSIMRKNVRK